MQLTTERILDAYRTYRCAFTAGAYGGGWRLPGRPNRCGNDGKTDDEKAFAVRSHNHAAAQLKTEVERIQAAGDGEEWQPAMGQEAERLLKSLTTPIEAPKPPRKLPEIEYEATSITRRAFADGERYLAPADVALRLTELQVEAEKRRQWESHDQAIPVDECGEDDDEAEPEY